MIPKPMTAKQVEAEIKALEARKAYAPNHAKIDLQIQFLKEVRRFLLKRANLRGVSLPEKMTNEKPKT
jgi:hypothetical protein